PVGIRVARTGGRSDDLHFAGSGAEPSNVAGLHREPERALVIEDRCVRATGIRFCHRSRVFGNVTGLSVEFPDVVLADPRKPDVTRVVLDQTVGPRPRGLQWVLLERTAARVDASEAVRELTCPPDRIVRGGE